MLPPPVLSFNSCKSECGNRGSMVDKMVKIGVYLTYQSKFECIRVCPGRLFAFQGSCAFPLPMDRSARFTGLMTGNERGDRDRGFSF